MGFANKVSLLRILVIPFFVASLIYYTPKIKWLVLAIFFFAVITDFVDGIIARVKKEIETSVDGKIHGIVHSIAFANYTDGFKPFHETNKKDFLQAVDISCFSLLAICKHFKELLEENGSVVTISICTTRMAAENIVMNN